MCNLIVLIIINFHSKIQTVNCIEEMKGFSNIYTVVVDNSNDFSNDANKDQKENVKIINPNQNLGYSGGCNYGIDYAMKYLKCEYFMIMNPDVLIKKQAVIKMQKILENLPMKSLLSCSTLYACDNSSNGQNYNSLKVSGLRTKFIDVKQSLLRTDIFNGCLFMGRLSELPPKIFDERLFMYFEELDFCLKNTDFSCYFTNEVQCIRSKNQEERNPLAVYHTVKNAIFLYKKYPQISILHCVELMIILLVRSLKYMIIKGNLKMLKEFFRGLGTWFRN